MTAASELTAMAKRLRAVPAEFVARAVDAVADELDVRIRADAGGDTFLSHGRGAGPVAYRVDRRSGRGTASATISPRGAPMAWLEQGTAPRRQGRRGRHPGTPARRTFTVAVDRSTRDLDQLGRRLVDDAVR